MLKSDACERCQTSNHVRVNITRRIEVQSSSESGRVPELLQIEIIIYKENQNFYNLSFTLHGLFMIFFLVMPGLYGGFFSSNGSLGPGKVNAYLLASSHLKIYPCPKNIVSAFGIASLSFSNLSRLQYNYFSVWTCSKVTPWDQSHIIPEKW